MRVAAGALLAVTVLITPLGFGASRRPDAAPAVPAKAVNVTLLPQGEREITAVSGPDGYVVRLAATGEVTRLADLDGNLLLEGNPRDLPAVSVWEGVGGRTRVVCKPTDLVAVEQVSPTEVKVAVTRGNGVTLTCRAQPERLTWTIAGPAGHYLLRGRYPCRMEGARVFAPGGVIFPSAGIGAVPGPEQSVIDAGRTRALTITREGGDGLRWTMNQLDGWAWNGENLLWDAELTGDQAVVLTSTVAPASTGPVKAGLYRRRSLRPEGQPLAVLELASAVLTGTAPVQVRLDRPIEQVVATGQLLAALIPAVPEDPVTAGECGAWFTRFDRLGAALIPVRLTPGDQPQCWQLALPGPVAAGAYRLRSWIVPKDTPLPEALGGPRGAVVGYFPGFNGRNTGIVQAFPLGDLLVTVGGSGSRSLTVWAPTLRQSFAGGERIPLLLQARGAIPTLAAQLRVTAAAGQVVVATRPVEFRLTAGEDRREFQLDTAELAPGSYTVTLAAPEAEEYPYTFFIVPPRQSGMVNLNSPLSGPHDLEAVTRLGVNGWVDVMPQPSWLTQRWPVPLAGTPGLYAADSSLPRCPWPGTTIYDQLAHEGMLFLTGMQSRGPSFGLQHSIPEHVQETLRKHLIYAQAGSGLPNLCGQILDYDLCGATGRYNFADTYARAGERRNALLKARWEAAWAAAKAQGAGETDKPRVAGLFYAEVIAAMYRESVSNLHEFVPGQRHSSAVTADHAGLQQGQYLPAVYQTLDYRYLECWNDQIYPNGAHDMQESFWTSLLRLGQSPGQPIWITAPTAPQPGTHFRRALETFARGANGTGYNAEGNAGLSGGWGPNPTESTVRTAQERQTGELVKRYGTWFNPFVPEEAIAILYSVSQGGTNFGQSSPVFFAYFTLAQLNRPARLLTEDEIAAGALREVKALLLVGQTNPLPAATQKAITEFAQAGGKVLADKNTKIELPGATALADVGWPAGLWPQGGNTYHNSIASFPRTLGSSLTAALGDIGRQPLECADAAVLVATKRAGNARLVFVTNNREYPFAELFTPEQQLTGFYRDFLSRGGVYFKDVRVPQNVALRLNADPAQSRPLIYDVFAGKLLTPVEQDGAAIVSLDLSALSARVLLLVDKPLAAPVLEVAQTAGSARVTFVVKSGVPLPVRLRVGEQEIYRAATPAGSCDTLTLGPAAGQVPIDVTELITGATQRGSVTLAAPVTAALREMPAVQLWDVPQIRKVLQADKLAVYVDAQQAGDQAAAAELAKRLGAELVVNPPIRDYPVSWDPPAADEAAKAEILQKADLAWRRPAEPNLQWSGAMAPAPVWNRPVILFGNVRNNRLMAELSRNAQLQRPALPEYLGSGGAIVQPVAAPFWNNQHAVVLFCGDAAGRDAAFAQLLTVAKGEPSALGRVLDRVSGKDHETFSAGQDGGARAAQQTVLGFAAPVCPKEVRSLLLATTTQPAERFPVILPIAALVAVEGGVLTAVHSPGRNLALLGRDQPETFTERWRVSSGAFYQPQTLLANGAGEAVVHDGTFLWRHAADGALRWKMLAAPLGTPDAAATVWVREGDNLEQIDASGRITVTLPVKESIPAIASDGRVVLVQCPGNKEKARAKADAALAALDLPGGQERWRVANLRVAQACFSANGNVVACIEHENMAGRDDIERDDASRLTVIDAANGAVRLRHPLGVALDHLLVTKDGARVIASGRGFSDTLYLADVATGLIRRVPLPEPGIWTYALTADERELWVAGASLFRINLETLEIATVAKGNFTALAARPGGGMFAGSDEDGAIVEFDATGRQLRAVRLAATLPLDNPTAAMGKFRDTPLVGSAWLRPHEVGELIPLVPEYPNHGNTADTISLRADAVFPVHIAVRIPQPGRFRVILDVALPRNEGDAIKPFRIFRERKTLGQTTPLQGDAWKQAVETDLDAGIYTISVAPVPPWTGGWKQNAPLRTMRLLALEPAETKTAP